MDNADAPICYRVARELLHDDAVAKKTEGMLFDLPFSFFLIEKTTTGRKQRYIKKILRTARYLSAPTVGRYCKH